MNFKTITVTLTDSDDQITYTVLKVFKDTDSYIRFLGMDTLLDIAVVTAQKQYSDDVLKYIVNRKVLIPINIDLDDD